MTAAERRPTPADLVAAVGPALLAGLLALRALVGGGADAGTLLAVAAGIAAIAGAVAWGVRLAPVLLLVGPIALVTTPARPELAYNLARPDDAGWFLFTVATMLAAGLCLAAAAVLAVRHRSGTRRGVRDAVMGAVAGVLLALAFAGTVWALDPQPDLGRGLSVAEREALPVVRMRNFAYEVEPLSVVDGRLQFRLENPSDLPHTFSVRSIDLDVYVPAGRTTYVDVAVDGTTLLEVYCGVGDHVERGMVLEVPLAG